MRANSTVNESEMAEKKQCLPSIEDSKNEGVKYPCGQCEYKAKQRSDLSRHTKSIHEGVKFPCEQCNYKATWKKDLLRHIKSIHQVSSFLVLNVITRQQRREVY